jgi:hypothetical protein
VVAISWRQDGLFGGGECSSDGLMADVRRGFTVFFVLAAVGLAVLTGAGDECYYPEGIWRCRGCYSFIWSGDGGGDIVVAVVMGQMEQ